MVDNRTRFLLTVEGLDDELQVLSFSGSESLSQLYRFGLEVVSTNPQLDFGKVINKSLVLGIFGEDDEPRFVQGVVAEIEQCATDDDYTIYQLTLVPALWRLTQRWNSRIFQEENLEEIVSKVLKDAGFAAGEQFRFVFKENHPKHEYRVQYRESDFAFVCRLLEEEGGWFFFEHSEDKHTMVIADTPAVIQPVAGESKITYRAAAGMVADGEHIQQFSISQRVQPGKVTLRDYDFKKPKLNLEVKSVGSANSNLEVYDYPGRYFDPAQGKNLAKYRLEGATAGIREGQGSSNVPRLNPGYEFQLDDHPRRDLNAKFLLTGVSHSGQQPQVLEAHSGGGGSSYSNSFQCIPVDVPFRDSVTTAKPRVEGPQTAIVVGPAGEEIYTDEHGRVKVLFHWDREGPRDDKSSCWIRVSQVSAGAGWGAMDVPRVGNEVIVDFLEGDPDQPIITGRVYHGANVPPFGLPDSGMVSGMKSNTTPGGGGYNEISMNDTKKKEQIVIHAQYDMNTTVEHNQTNTIRNNQTSTVEKNQVLSVHVNRTVNVGQDETLTVKRDRKRKVVEGDEEVEVTAGSRLTKVPAGEDALEAKDIKLTASNSIEIVCGGGSIKMDATGKISIKGVNLESVAGAMNDIKGAIVKINS